MQIETFYDPRTYTLTYVAYDPATRDAVIVDPVLDYDPLAVTAYTESVDKVMRFIDDVGLKVHSVLETHAHADHISASQLLKDKYGAEVVIGDAITKVQETFKGVFNFGPDFVSDGSQFDRLVKDGASFDAGSLKVEVIATPGHTPACVCYKIDDAVFTGDSIFMPDFGTGRCDFPNGSAEDLYDSIQKLYALPDDTRLLVGHDYQPGGREVAWETTVGKSKTDNIQLKGETSKADFVRFRTERDQKLKPPVLLFQSVQININAGRMPAAEDNGRRYLKLPVGLFG